MKVDGNSYPWSFCPLSHLHYLYRQINNKEKTTSNTTSKHAAKNGNKSKSNKNCGKKPSWDIVILVSCFQFADGHLILQPIDLILLRYFIGLQQP